MLKAGDDVFQLSPCALWVWLVSSHLSPLISAYANRNAATVSAPLTLTAFIPVSFSCFLFLLPIYWWLVNWENYPAATQWKEVEVLYMLTVPKPSFRRCINKNVKISYQIFFPGLCLKSEFFRSGLLLDCVVFSWILYLILDQATSVRRARASTSALNAHVVIVHDLFTYSLSWVFAKCHS